MTSLELVKPWRLLASMLPLLYGALLILGLPQSWLWLLLVCSVLLIIVMIAARLEYPMLALWPAFVGLFLIGTCICALIQDVVDYAFVPFTDSDGEIVLAISVGAAFILWGIQTTKKLLAY